MDVVHARTMPGMAGIDGSGAMQGSCTLIEAAAGQAPVLWFIVEEPVAACLLCCRSTRIIGYGMASPAASVNTIHATLCNLALMCEEIRVHIPKQIQLRAGGQKGKSCLGDLKPVLANQQSVQPFPDRV